MREVKELTGLAKLREPFPENQISKLPKPTRKQTDAVKQNFKNGIRCKICGGWHHPDVIHLDYVGHAALTDRLLDCDPKWYWEPMARAEDGLPKYDSIGGLWICLTVCEFTRLGYGNAGDKKGGDAIKEVIGDALRNAAMRFGAALDLWHKGELHLDDDGNGVDDKDDKKKDPPSRQPSMITITNDQAEEIRAMLPAADKSESAITSGYNISKLELLLVSQFDDVKKKLNEYIDKREDDLLKLNV